jgi:hypothetical protein
VSTIVVTFGQDDDAEGFVRSLLGRGVAPEAISQATAGGYGEPHDGHRLVVVQVGASEEEHLAALAVTWRGQFHEPPYSDQVLT